MRLLFFETMKKASLEEMALAINEYNENHGSETRYWIEPHLFVCHNALSDMDDIYEINAEQIEKAYDKIKDKL